jgi:hypothetical protein
MPKTIEYADLSNGTTFTDKYYVNGLARFKCNNEIITDTSRNEAVEAYTKLYQTYYKYDSNVPIPPTSQIANDLDSACVPSKCPFSTGTLNQSNPNVLAYTKGESSTGTDNQLLVRDLKFYLDDCGARIHNYDTKHIADLSASFISVKKSAINFRDVSYNTLVRSRNDLDNKMNEILANNKNSILYEKQSELDVTVYSTLLWTVMVTSLIYYVFTKI